MPSHGKARDLTAAALQNHETFRRSGFAMTATDKPNEVSWGYLPEEDIAEFRKDRDAGRITYVVLSYNTPIAWVLDDGTKVIPTQRYSVTTTNHQGMCRQYL